MMTRRYSERRLRPDREPNNAFIHNLAFATRKGGISVVCVSSIGTDGCPGLLRRANWGARRVGSVAGMTCVSHLDLLPRRLSPRRCSFVILTTDGSVQSTSFSTKNRAGCSSCAGWPDDCFETRELEWKQSERKFVCIWSHSVATIRGLQCLVFCDRA